ncbi:MAG TPA: hypothetical protein VGL53_05670 [Bryobacteraceae bacterium]
MTTKPIAMLVIFLTPAIFGETIPLADLGQMDLKNSAASWTPYKGAPSLLLVEKTTPGPTGESWAEIRNRSFHNGVIEVDVAGAPSAQAAGTPARGFIGVSFHIQPGAERFETFYIRPTNGRADDQLRRNHSTQYTSTPDWPWERLRKETPGVYESYADLIPGEWTHLRIVVHGTEARLFVGSSDQPALIVHDLKLGDTKGSVALWIGPGTEGHFKNLTISNE